MRTHSTRAGPTLPLAPRRFRRRRVAAQALIPSPLFLPINRRSEAWLSPSPAYGGASIELRPWLPSELAMTPAAARSPAPAATPAGARRRREARWGCGTRFARAGSTAAATPARAACRRSGVP
ncbi:hypothetical protein AXF42_Ash006012 [Apostasia shenzhenica]|uniref:Uncharacterized protein n=1 Tax=Apostasia shenzhenica TaxID=1088818 RepID=A0A2I0B010_9ASPA|nr:hypothetical protein AXF42_Ash006012 [Apostasia shenzhenica]